MLLMRIKGNPLVPVLEMLIARETQIMIFFFCNLKNVYTGRITIPTFYAAAQFHETPTACIKLTSSL
jgi:hypothetical protein